MIFDFVIFMLEQPRAMENLFFWLRDDLRSRVDLSETIEPLVRNTIKLVQDSFPAASPLLLSSLEEITLRHFSQHDDFVKLHNNVFQTGIRLNPLAPEIEKFAIVQKLFCEISYDSLGSLMLSPMSAKERALAQSEIVKYCIKAEIPKDRMPLLSERGLILPVQVFILPRPAWIELIFKEAFLMHNEAPDREVAVEALPVDVEDAADVVYAPHVLAFLNTNAVLWQQRIWEMALEVIPRAQMREMLWSKEEIMAMSNNVRAGWVGEDNGRDAARTLSPDVMNKAIDGVLSDLARRPHGPLGIGFSLVVVRGRDSHELNTYVLTPGEGRLLLPELVAEAGYELAPYNVTKKIKVIGSGGEGSGGGIYIIPRLLKQIKSSAWTSDSLLIELLEQRLATELSNDS